MPDVIYKTWCWCKAPDIVDIPLVNAQADMKSAILLILINGLKSLPLHATNTYNSPNYTDAIKAFICRLHLFNIAFIPVCNNGILSPFLHTHRFYSLSLSLSLSLCLSLSLLVLMMTSHVFMYY